MKNWNWFRILRLILGCIIIGQAFIMKDIVFGIAGLLFAAMAIFNTSCCGINGCYVQQPKPKQNETVDIQYEEIK